MYKNLLIKENKVLFGNFIFDVTSLELKEKNSVIYLTEGENNLLLKLINKKNEIVLREELADQSLMNLNYEK